MEEVMNENESLKSIYLYRRFSLLFCNVSSINRNRGQISLMTESLLFSRGVSLMIHSHNNILLFQSEIQHTGQTDLLICMNKTVNMLDITIQLDIFEMTPISLLAKKIHPLGCHYRD